jgi:hypothetical protein
MKGLLIPEKIAIITEFNMNILDKLSNIYNKLLK